MMQYCGSQVHSVFLHTLLLLLFTRSKLTLKVMLNQHRASTIGPSCSALFFCTPQTWEIDPQHDVAHEASMSNQALLRIYVYLVQIFVSMDEMGCDGMGRDGIGWNGIGFSGFL